MTKVRALKLAKKFTEMTGIEYTVYCICGFCPKCPNHTLDTICNHWDIQQVIYP